MAYYLRRYYMSNPTIQPVRPDNRVPNTQVQSFDSENPSKEDKTENCCSSWNTTTLIVGLLATVTFIVAAIVVTVYLVPLLALTTTTRTTTTTTTTTSTTTTSVTTTTAVTLYIPSNYYTACSAACTNVTTTSSVLASWKFEYTLYDSVGGYNGYISSGGASYVVGYVGQALAINSAQYVTVGSYLNLNSRSFTVEAWIYITSSLSSSIDYEIFGQYQTYGTRTNLFYIIRGKKFYMGFYYDDIPGGTTLSLNSWIHVAFVYDITTNTKSIYYNGLLDGSSTSGSSYQGTSGSTNIGYGILPGSVTPLPGYIDQVTVSNLAKTACQILNDASLVSHFTFDGTIADVGPNTLSSSVTIQSNNGISYSSGRVNQGLLLSSSNAFFQSCGYYALGVNNHPFSFALWINPTIIGGTILHLSSDQSGAGGWCLPIIGFSSNGSIVVQSWLSPAVSVIGPQIPTNNWTHIVQTWSSTNGLRLYVNGALYGSAAMGTYSSGQNVMCIFLGTSGFGTYCNTGAIVMGTYSGIFDEFYVYNRELTANEVCPLAHP